MIFENDRLGCLSVSVHPRYFLGLYWSVEKRGGRQGRGICQISLKCGDLRHMDKPTAPVLQVLSNPGRLFYDFGPTLAMVLCRLPKRRHRMRDQFSELLCRFLIENKLTKTYYRWYYTNINKKAALKLCNMTKFACGRDDYCHNFSC